jgi:nucleotide-binding universal stress UspA family protein
MGVMIVVAVIVAAWLMVGAAVGVVEARRGYWRLAWVVSAMLGPFAIPLALQRRRLAMPDPVVLARGRTRRGRVDVLVGFDGSSDSIAAAELAIGLFGPRVRRVTLATVLDIDTAAPHADSRLYPQPWPEERQARELLDAAAVTLRASSGHEAGQVVLAGDPADALENYAREEGYEVIVVGCRGHGLSKMLLGSCASRLAGKTAVPVLIIPREPAAREPGATSATPASANRR